MRRRVDTLYHHGLAHVLSCVLQMDYRVSVDTCINVCVNVCITTLLSHTTCQYMCQWCASPKGTLRGITKTECGITQKHAPRLFACFLHALGRVITPT